MGSPASIWTLFTHIIIELSGTLGGAAAFACAMHEIAMLIYSKSVSCICPSKVAEDSAQAPEEEPSVEEVPNSTNDSSSLWSALTHNGTGQARRLFPPPSAGQNVIEPGPVRDSTKSVRRPRSSPSNVLTNWTRRRRRSADVQARSDGRCSAATSQQTNGQPSIVSQAQAVVI